MDMDISSFRDLFVEESFEGLSVMESGLLSLTRVLDEPAAGIDPETINRVFRAAHSIKGGSGVFGFNDLIDLTHLLETLLDELRQQRRTISQELAQLLLDATDCLRAMLEAERQQAPRDPARIAEITGRLQAALGEAPNPAQPPGPDTTTTTHLPETGTRASGAMAVWRIVFRPSAQVFKNGSDLFSLFEDLGALGGLALHADTAQLPRLAVLDPEICHLGWQAELTTGASLDELKAVFDWFEGDCCELSIERVEPAAAELPASHLPPATAPAAAAAAVVVAAEKPEPGNGRALAGPGPGPGPVPAPTATRSPESSSIRVSTEKVDAIINLVGELIITQSMLNGFGDYFDMSMAGKLRDGLTQLARNTRELQETVLKIRMLPISHCFNRFPRLVHDLSASLGKKVTLRVTGEQTELDKTVLEKINDPLVHLVRNSLDHGIEKPEARLAAGKPAEGTLHLHAEHKGGGIVIEVSDDGAGLNTARILAKARERGIVEPGEALPTERIHELIFAPGFSTVDQVTDLSGRGVGMDVVRGNVMELGGRIEIRTKPGEGTTFLIRLPLTLAILDGQLVRVSGQTFVIPMVSIVESLLLKPEQVNRVGTNCELYHLRDEHIPIIRLHQLFRLSPPPPGRDRGLLVVIEAEGRKAAILVDDLLAQQQVVIKSLEDNLEKAEGVSAATILGDGTVALILDIPGILSISRSRPGGARSNQQLARAGEENKPEEVREYSFSNQ